MGYLGRTPEDARREQEQKHERIRKTLSYPFTDSTLKERRNVLAVSVLGILVAYVGIVPKSLPIFGVELATGDQENLLVLLSIAVLYFAISFYLRAFSDVAAMILVAKEEGKEKPASKIVTALATVFSARLLIDVGVPLVTAAVALAGLVRVLAF